MTADPNPSASPARGKRLPPWLKVGLPRSADFARTASLVAAHGLCTVCKNARCPNIFECYSRGTATFLILGERCTRGCTFCNIASGPPSPPDPDEPQRVARAALELGVRHVVVTSVTRDDLPDGGAGHFAAVTARLRETLPGAGVELLTPDFGGCAASLDVVLDAGPDIFNHNVETVPELYPLVRPQADYGRSLAVLRRAASRPGMRVKSGFMLGFGERPDQARRVIEDLARAGCAMITVGQYLRPSRRHPEPVRYVHPDEFAELAAFGRDIGVAGMFCGPLVRSSYHADERAAAQEAGSTAAAGGCDGA
ncbi:lipoyl synthase [Desulfovibrio sulfodismutans]|uniref:Lipoyl synthase n=1 Tax=Desulfolutivibrio sulfodismutans TaxID=63561 RepID=A0A7K3NS60_9BACT|nr:lipoyl synthase [Desulfolutivibrio sulfodismutans]NDY58039.1 lipoyl synthase [Desulfolutivibrio sulfodismutans]QLA11851.1 lipoyl synthase [Desulfolutivibrio sulfodismutans DSM 3696]